MEQPIFMTAVPPAFSAEGRHLIQNKVVPQLETYKATCIGLPTSLTDINMHDNTLIACNDQHLHCERDPPQPSTNSKQTHNHSSLWCTTTAVGFMYLPMNNVRSVRLSWIKKING